MTAVDVSHTDIAHRSEVIRSLFQREPYFAAMTFVLVVAAIPMMLALQIDGRTLFEVNVWVKPLKFELALITYLATLVLFAGWLPSGTVSSTWYRRFSALIVFCIAGETLWIAGAAANGVESHFNDDSVMMVALYALMGIFAVTLTSATLVYGLLFLRDDNSPLHPVFRLSLAYGLILTFVLTVIVAGYMANIPGSHLVGGNGSDAEAFSLMGWARDGGDLRVAHFFATHAMHVIPLVGFVVSRMLPTKAAQTLVVLASAAFTGFVIYTFVQALMGQPFLPGIA